MALGREQLEPQLLQAVLQQPAGLVVAGPDVLEALLGDPGQARVQADDHRHRRGVVVGPPTLAGGFAHVAPQQTEVEVPGRGFSTRRSKARSLIVNGDRPGARRGTSGCRCTRHRPRGVGQQLDPGEAGDPVGDQQRAALGRAAAAMSERTPVEVSACTAAYRAGAGWASSIRWTSTGRPHSARRRRPRHRSGRRRRHPLAEESVHADDHDVAVVDRVDERRLHAGAAGRTDREGAGVGGAPGLAEQLARLVHDAQELGIEVPEQRTAQGVGRLGVRVGRAGAEEVPLVDHGPTLPISRDGSLRTPRRG